MVKYSVPPLAGHPVRNAFELVEDTYGIGVDLTGLYEPIGKTGPVAARAFLVNANIPVRSSPDRSARRDESAPVGRQWRTRPLQALARTRIS